MQKPNPYTSRGSSQLVQREHDEEDEEEEQEEKVSLGRYLLSLGRDILIAVIIMVIIIGGLYWYTGNWPPMVVIESNSMMHGDDSNVGTIDTGDLVLVKSINNRKDITTYVEGKKNDYKTYGSYGDVVIYKKNGLDDTPVIHRAVVFIEYNDSGYNVHSKLWEYGSWDIPSMGLYNVTSFWIADYEPDHINLTVDLKIILTNFQRTGHEPHGGFLIKGDNNPQVDQVSNLADREGVPVEPVKDDWIVGRAEGELPWFGLIKLYISGETNEPNKAPPETSKNMLIISIALIIIIPIILDILFSIISNRREKRKKERAKEEQDTERSKPIFAKDQARFGPMDRRGIANNNRGIVPGKDPTNRGKPQMGGNKPMDIKDQQYEHPGLSKDEMLKKIR